MKYNGSSNPYSPPLPPAPQLEPEGPHEGVDASVQDEEEKERQKKQQEEEDKSSSQEEEDSEEDYE